jgi:hypothetical protein
MNYRQSKAGEFNMTVATVDRPVRLSDMGRREAEEVTLAIKNNFDSLGSMLLQARDRKAYKALGYKSFDTYCKTEFGKSISHAYQLIEDVKVIASLEAEISKQYDEPITLKIPSSHLRPLKDLPEIGDKLKAIEYANKLAATEGKQPTKKHLEIAVFQISGHRSDDFKSAIESFGFTKGTPVEMTKTLKQDRGFVTKIDKRGKIYVELYNGGAVPIPCDASDLRILSDSEKPAVPTNDNTIDKGDKVKIFAKGLEGKTGEIYTWKMGKHAMVLVEGESAPTTIAYAELELISNKDIEAAIAVAVVSGTEYKWEDSEWTSGKNRYYYFAREDKIYSTSWPTGLTLKPYSHGFNSPAQFMEQWEKRFAPVLLESLADINPLKKEKENEKLHEQLAEANAIIEELVKINQSIKTDTGLPADTEQSVQQHFEKIENAASTEPEKTTKLLLENTRVDSWRDLLKANNFHSSEYHLDGCFKGHWRGWNIFFCSPNGGVIAIDIAKTEDEMFTMSTEVDFDLDLDEDKMIDWTRRIINQVEDFCPGQLSLDFVTQVIRCAEEKSPDLLNRIVEKRKALLNKLETEKSLKVAASKKESDKISRSINNLTRRLQDLEIFEKFNINQPVTKRHNKEITGRISGFEFSQGGMPLVWVIWKNDEGKDEKIPENLPVASIAASET